MRTALICIAAVAIDLSSGFAGQNPPFPAPRPDGVDLVLRNIWTERKTEVDADEVYVLVFGRRSDGKTFSARYAADMPHQEPGHWNMNTGNLGCNRPSGNSQCIENKPLGTFATPSNASWEIAIAFMEEDNGLGTTPEGMVANAVAQGGGNFVLTTLALIKEILLRNTDDFLGSVSARIDSTESGLTVTWSNLDRVYQSTPYLKDPLQQYGFKMNGDGSNYTAHIVLK